MEMKEGSTDELEATVKPIMKGRHALEIRIHDKVVFRKEIETINEASFQNIVFTNKRLISKRLFYLTRTNCLGYKQYAGTLRKQIWVY